MAEIAIASAIETVNAAIFKECPLTKQGNRRAATGARRVEDTYRRVRVDRRVRLHNAGLGTHAEFYADALKHLEHRVIAGLGAGSERFV